MQQYVNQLLEDLKSAERPEQLWPLAQKQQSIEEHLEEVEQWLQSSPDHTFSYHCGLNKEIFPPAERLSRKQLKQLVVGLNQLLYSFNIGVDVPKKLPIEKTYSLIVSVMDRKVEIMDDGLITIEFCTYNVPSCPFGEHCMCIKYENDYERESDAESSRDETPF